MTTIFSTQKRQYRDIMSRIVTILEFIKKQPNVTKWRMSCVLVTSTTSIDNIIDVAERYNLVKAHNKKYTLTPKGIKLLEVLLCD